MGELNTANTSYPTALDTYTPLADGIGVDEILAEHHNGPDSAIIAIETELGTLVKGSATNLKTRLAVCLAGTGAINSGIAFPVNPNPVDGQLFWRNDLKQFYIYDGALAQWQRIDGYSDHSLLGNLLVDTHTQYLDVAGTRPATNGLGLKGGTAFAITLTGTPTQARAVVIPDAADTLVNLASTQTLLNKTVKAIGTVTNDNAAVGIVGEYVESVKASGSAVTLTSVNFKTVTSVSLTAGDWDVCGVIDYIPAGNFTSVVSGISIVNNSAGGQDSASELTLSFTSAPQRQPTPTIRMSLSGTTTVYLIGYAAFTVGCTAYGTIRARRIR